MAGKFGVHSQQPENAALERELRCLYGTRAEISSTGRGRRRRITPGACPSWSRRTPSRFPTGPGPTACQPVKGSQAGAGQPLGR
jgi:hypothetical protein